MERNVDKFKNSLLSVDRIKAENLLHEFAVDSPLVDHIDKLIVPALEEIGRGWESGEISLSQVYMSSRICEDFLEDFLPAVHSDNNKQPDAAIVTLEDSHILGKRIVTSMLRSAGFNLLDYGYGIDAERLVDRVIKEEIKILLISVLMLRSAIQVEEVVGKLKTQGSRVQVAVGGAPFLLDTQLWKEVGADTMGKNASEAISIVKSLKGDLS